MVRGYHRLGALLALAFCGCSGVTPPQEGSGQTAEAIIGGQTDTTHKGVFGVVIKNQALCSASLILPNLLLTAHHCVADVSTGEGPIDCTKSTFGTPYAASGFVSTYASDLGGNVAQNSIFDIDKVYVPADNHVCGSDIALLRLTTNVASTAAATLTPRVDEPPVVDEPFSAVGYGLTDPNDTQGMSAGVRRVAGNMQVGCVGAIQCAGTRATQAEWAANAAICSGDSGGPALDADGQVIGVASRADTTCTLGLYSSVAAFKQTIVDAATDAANDGGYDPPAWVGGTTMPSGGMGGGGMGSGGASGSAGSSATGSGGKSGMGGMGGRASMGGSGMAGATSARGGRGGAAGSATSTGGAGSPSSGGTAGMPPADAGAPPPDSGAGRDGGLINPGPMLGESCTNSCFGSLLCYSSSGKPPGECVPACSASNKVCPATYTCDVSLGACVPKDSGNSSDSASTTTSGGCGCRVGGVGEASSASAWQALGMMALWGGMLRRRRRNTA